MTFNFNHNTCTSQPATNPNKALFHSHPRNRIVLFSIRLQPLLLGSHAAAGRVRPDDGLHSHAASGRPVVAPPASHVTRVLSCFAACSLSHIKCLDSQQQPRCLGAFSLCFRKQLWPRSCNVNSKTEQEMRSEV
jgi:hypothetical protein